MSEGDGMVTDEDREKAMQIMAWDPLSYEGLAQAVQEGNDPDDRDSLETVDAIAAALAEEREKAYRDGGTEEAVRRVRALIRRIEAIDTNKPDDGTIETHWFNRGMDEAYDNVIDWLYSDLLGEDR